MRNWIIITGMFFLTVFGSKAQEKVPFKLMANWKPGEVKEMIVKQSGLWEMSGDEDTIPMEISAKYLITITDKSEKGYMVEWKIINTNKELEDNELLKDYISGFKYLIETDLNGKFIGLYNWKSLIELNKELKGKFISAMKQDNVSEPESENIIAQMKLAETRDELVDNCKSLTDVFHGIYGEELLLNDTTREQTTISNEQIEEGIPATLETITRDLGDDKIFIRYAYLYDYEKIRVLQEKYFPDQEYIEQKMDFYSEYIYNNKTGWIEKITFYTEFESTGSRSLMKIEYIIK